jgi:hypothetical protein
MRRASLGLCVELALALGSLAAGCRRTPSTPTSGVDGNAAVQFVDVAEASGIHFTHFDGRSGRKYVLEIVGSGAAFFDYDGDADPDIYLVNGAALPGYEGPPGSTDLLYENRGGSFTDVTEKAGIRQSAYGHGCAAGDYDGDGDLDLYVTRFGDNALYRNNGNGTFTDVAKEAGVTEPNWSTSCAFADYDLDGDLDLYVVNYLEFSVAENPWCGLKEKGFRAYCEPNNFPGQPDALYRNNGNGTFTNVTKEAGVLDRGKGLGVVWGDYDNDGDPDLYVANDSTENLLYRNRGNGTFEEVGFASGVAVSQDGVVQNGMGTAFGDWNNDGWLDLIVTNYAKQMNSLYRNDGDGFFTDLSTSSRTGAVSYPEVGWGTEFFDYDNDGWLDIFVANGHLHDNLADLGQEGTYGQRNFLFKNRRDGTFDEISNHLGPSMRLEEVSRGAAFADYDLDGDVDILVTNSHGPPRLLRNDGGNRGHWLAILLAPANGHADAIGARVIARVGNTMQLREVRSGSGYLSQNELKMIFGLGDSTAVDRLEIAWPSGRKQVLEHVPANQTLTVREPQDGPAGK